MTNPSSNKP